MSPLRTLRNAALAAAAATALGACVTVPQAGNSLGELEAVLASHESATAALEEWCAMRRFADPARVVAEPAGGRIEPSAQSRASLELNEDAPVGYRHVRLSCGGRVLSDAHNWYVPARLTAEMNHVLETTRTPFGRVVMPLGFRRERLAGQRGPAEGCPEDTVLSHRALLRLPGGDPISLVIECYTAAAVE